MSEQTTDQRTDDSTVDLPDGTDTVIEGAAVTDEPSESGAGCRVANAVWSTASAMDANRFPARPANARVAS